MNGIIVYKSKYGAAKKYADWISQATGFSVLEASKAAIDEVQKYDVIIFGGGIYASGIAGLPFLSKHMDRLKSKKVIVFCCGASPYEEKSFQAIVQHNMKEELRGIPCFYCRGSWDMKSMNIVDRNLCKMLRKAVAKKDPNDYEVWEKALMAAGDDPCDWTDKEYIKPILEELNKLYRAKGEVPMDCSRTIHDSGGGNQ